MIHTGMKSASFPSASLKNTWFWLFESYFKILESYRHDRNISYKTINKAPLCIYRIYFTQRYSILCTINGGFRGRVVNVVDHKSTWIPSEHAILLRGATGVCLPMITGVSLTKPPKHNCSLRSFWTTWRTRHMLCVEYRCVQGHTV